MQNEIHKKMQSGFHTGQKCHKFIKGAVGKYQFLAPKS